MDPEQNQSNPTYPTQPSQVRQPVGPHSQNKNKKTLAVLFVIVAVILIAGSVFLYLGKRKESKTMASPTPESFDSLVYEETPEPSETASPSVDKSEISVSVLNGTGTAKDASFVKDLLVDLGYEEDKIEVGNASPQSYTSTEVSFTEDVSKTIQDEIVTALKKEYQTVKNQTSSSQTVDVKIITGLKTGQTPKPSATATPSSTATPKATASPTPTATP